MKNIFTSKVLIIRSERKVWQNFQEKTFKNIWWVIKNAITLHSLLRNKASDIEKDTIDKSSTRANKKVLSQFLNKISQAGSSEREFSL